MMDVVSERGQNVTPLDLWPCPIGLFNAGEGVRELNKLLVKDAFEEKTKERNRPSRTGVDVWQSSNTLQDKYESFQQLQQILGGAVFAMMARCGYKEEDLPKHAVTSLWANITESNYGFHQPHIHGDGKCVWTGVYYPANMIYKDGPVYCEDLDKPIVDLLRPTSEPKPGDLIMYDPARIAKRAATPSYVDRYPYYAQEFCFTPREGACVLFPAWLEHSTSPHGFLGGTRMSISFAVLRT
jgi:hypothetical protein